MLISLVARGRQKKSTKEFNGLFRWSIKLKGCGGAIIGLFLFSVVLLGLPTPGGLLRANVDVPLDGVAFSRQG